MRLILIGFGVVGQGFRQRFLRDKADRAEKSSMASAAEIVGVVTASKRGVILPRRVWRFDGTAGSSGSSAAAFDELSRAVRACNETWQPLAI